jgi:Ca-activated chloride channel homolog
MRPALITASLTALVLGLPGSPAPPVTSRPAAQEQSPDKTLSPYFWVRSESGEADQLPLKSTTVSAAISGVIADVKVAQVYRNEGRRPLEAVYVFPGSTRAAVYAMTMQVGSRTIQARIRAKDVARQEYEAARAQGQRASLLEQQRANVFQMNVANIQPGDEIRVELSYAELLVPEEGTYRFVYPTVVGPRYSNARADEAPASEKWVANPYLQEGAKSPSTLSLEVRLMAGLPIARIGCDTHRHLLTWQGKEEATLRLDPAEKLGGNRDVVMSYELAGKQVQSGLLLARGKDENFFLLMVQPPKRISPAQVPPREYVFIMDVSGSMSGFPIETSKALMARLVGQLRSQDRFNLEVFENGSALWSPGGSQPATPENLQSALAFVRSQSGGGGTEILSALKRALALPRTEGFSRTFVIATDGYISVEPQVFQEIRAHLGSANLFAFGIGSSVNRLLIEGMAHAGMGEPFVVADPGQAPEQAERFRQYVSSPVLAQVKASFRGFQVYDVEPPQLPDVLADRPVICFGKWRGEPKGDILVTGQGGEGIFSQTFHVGLSPVTASPQALGLLWARHRIQLLSDFAGLAGAESQRQPITDLGLKYGLLTDFTSFVAIDSEKTSGQPSERVVQPLPLPQGVSNLAVGAPPPMSVGMSAKLSSAGAPAPMLRVEERQMKAALEPNAPRKAETGTAQDATRVRRVVGPITTPTPDLPLEALRTALERKLREPALAALLGTLPPGTPLELDVDSRGTLTAVRIQWTSQAATDLEQALKGWRIPGWTRKIGANLRTTLN